MQTESPRPVGLICCALSRSKNIRTFVKDHDLKGKQIAALACQIGAEKAFDKLKAVVGIDKLEAELVLIDTKAKPNSKNDRKIEDFCSTG